MSNKYLNLDHVPALTAVPFCETCSVEVDIDYHADWVCPSCGTRWDGAKTDYDEGEGERYEDWSGKTRTGPIAPRKRAYLYAKTSDPYERDRQIIADSTEEARS